MRKYVLIAVCICLASAGPAAAGSPPKTTTPSETGCADEVLALRGVWLPQQVFLPAFGDLDLLKYLASLGGRKAGVAVLPLLSSEPVYFRSDKVVFVSTGFILNASGETELAGAIQSARRKVRTPALPSCAVMSTARSERFADVRQRLAAQVAAYEGIGALRLLRREPAAQ